MKGKKTFRDLLNTGKPFVGTYMQLASEDILEIIALSGMDYVIFDNEHPMMSQSELRRFIRIADGLGIASMVRVSGVHETEIKHVLDAGCCAISVPNINSLDDAKKVVEYARFAPLGYRGISDSSRANQFGMAYDVAQFTRQSNEDVVILCAIEGPDALKDMEDLVKLPGIDVYAVGFGDLSCRMGIPGQYDDPRISGAVDKIHELAFANGKHAVITTFDPEFGRRCMTGEYKTSYLCYGMDALLISQTYCKTVNFLKNGEGSL